jgi:hypothetical protein
MIGPLADNGGATETHAVVAGSIAIDKGNSFGTAMDQRFYVRPVDLPGTPNAAGGDGSDIGAYEFQSTAAAAVTISGRITDSAGSAIPRARIFLTDAGGNTLYTLGSPFGYFRFDGVPVGGTYVISVEQKRYRFVPVVVTPFGDLTDVDITAEP